MTQETENTNQSAPDGNLVSPAEVTLEQTKQENIAEGIDPGMFILILQQAKEDYKSYKNWKKMIGAKFMLGSDKKKWIQGRVIELLIGYKQYLANKSQQEKTEGISNV